MRGDIADQDSILGDINSFDPDLQFTLDRPLRDDHGYWRLPFLDILVKWENDGFGETSVYRKPTTSKIVMPFDSFGPDEWKNGTLIGAIRRAVTHTSTHVLMHHELKQIREQFALVGYPYRLIDQKIKITLEKMLGDTENTDFKTKNCDEKSNRWLILHLPWSGKQAGFIIGSLRRLVPREFCRLSIAYHVTKVRDILPRFTTSPARPTPLQAKNVVYKYSCDCGKKYIGQTKRRLAVRAAEHAQEKSPMMEHIKSCETGFSRTNFSVVARNFYGRKAREKYETLYIKFYDRRAISMNICTASRALTIF